MERGIIVPMMLPAFPDSPCAVDDKVKVDANDTTSGYLAAKLQAGTNVTFTTQNVGGNESILISATGGSSADEKVKVSANDTTAQYLGQKLNAGSDVTITTTNPGGNENLAITAANNKVQVSANDNQHQYLGQKLQAGTNITLNTLNPGANERLEIVCTATSGIPPFTMTAAENLSAGDLVNINSSGQARKADASNGRIAHGYVTANVTSGNTATVTPIGSITTLSGLVPGASYYLSASSAGAVTVTAPSTAGQTVHRIGFAVSTTQLFFAPQIPILLS